MNQYFLLAALLLSLGHSATAAEDAHGHGAAPHPGAAEKLEHDGEDKDKHEEHEEKDAHAKHAENEAEHEKEDEHAGHAGEGGELPLLSPAQQQELGITQDSAGPGGLHHSLRLNGEIKLDEENTVHVIPPLSGIVKAVHKKLGAEVKQGEALALLESRELADAKAEYLAALEQLALIEDDYQRKETLLKKQALAEQQLFEARRERAEARIRRNSAARKLHALGFSDAYIRALPEQSRQKLTEYTLSAPMDGVVVEKHITLGEVFNDESRGDEARAFVISDLSSLWVDFSVYPQDLAYLRQGQKLLLEAADGLPAAQVEILYVSPLVDRETRTALVRARLPNPDGQWRAGLFVSAALNTEEIPVALALPRSALVRVEDGMAVFVVEEHGYELREVKTGREDREQVEILSGLEAGESYVSQGAFILKAEQDKAVFGEAGHAH